jgi:hypothetical protein
MMKVIKIAKAKPRRVPFWRERDIYALFAAMPEVLEKPTLFRLLSINKGPEKGPDFIAVNKKGHLLIGEIKNRSFRTDGWIQAKHYAKRFAKMREPALDTELGRAGVHAGIRKAVKGFLGSTAMRALLNPSGRRLQSILVAESFSDKVLRSTRRDDLGVPLKSKVKDVKCIVVRMFAVPRAARFAIATVITGKRRKLRR